MLRRERVGVGAGGRNWSRASRWWDLGSARRGEGLRHSGVKRSVGAGARARDRPAGPTRWTGREGGVELAWYTRRVDVLLGSGSGRARARETEECTQGVKHTRQTSRSGACRKEGGGKRRKWPNNKRQQQRQKKKKKKKRKRKRTKKQKKKNQDKDREPGREKKGREGERRTGQQQQQ
ncbi:hypothetical protein J3E71DRAFT_240223 [Bipolaris maydis]|nr:hypothetical protein J3E73DRAFT_256930 [Bipolaris maydis]KAJ6282661.1 hypothetical protein J3E71DRAFT_240223 [Bipolaris maydis]